MPAELRRRVEERWREAVLSQPPDGWRGGARALSRRSSGHLAVVHLHHHPRSHPEEQAFTIAIAVLSRVLADYRCDRLTVEPLSHSDRWSWSHSTYPEYGWFGFDLKRDDTETAQALRRLVVPDLLQAAESQMDDARLLELRWRGMTNPYYLSNTQPGIPFAGSWPTWVEAGVLAVALDRHDVFDRVVDGLERVVDDRRVSGPGFVEAELKKLRALRTRG